MNKPPPSDPKTEDRRAFLKILAGGAATAIGVTACQSNPLTALERYHGSDKRKLLLISNTRLPNKPWFSFAHEWIQEHFDASAKNRKKVLFIPYAFGTSDDRAKNVIAWEDYTKKMADALKPLGIDIVSVLDESGHEKPPEKLWKDAAGKDVNGILVGGGNTFCLLDELQRQGLLDTIKKKVDGGMPFMGSSAGINIAAPTIMTTNDMPIVQPQSMNALGLVPFQINPHYVEGQFYYAGEHGNFLEKLGNRLQEFLNVCTGFFGDKGEENLKTVLKLTPYNGETRDERLTQFAEKNKVPVVALREGGGLRIVNGKAELLGKSAKIFRHEEKEPTVVAENSKAISELISQADRAAAAR